MATDNVKPAQTYFEQQRELILNEVAVNLENVLQNINHLNRSLEGVIAVGNEFSQVEGLWSQFENVMAKPPPPTSSQSTGEDAAQPQGQDQEQQALG